LAGAGTLYAPPTEIFYICIPSPNFLPAVLRWNFLPKLASTGKIPRKIQGFHDMEISQITGCTSVTGAAYICKCPRNFYLDNSA
jgi:hypothetical protein